ncbi:hypothetical protein DL93DRAFT_2183387 [Clavulina sp. PMI_390]|nr:hypothetical protein DL93DRAFT_2183387 [Clavulina sp. PMI_390]
MNVPGTFPPNAALMPLPYGWSEHVAPSGHPYYFNNITNESTYVRPIAPAIPNPPLNIPSNALPPKKEKPVSKIPIPNSPWVRVKTNLDNIFFTHSERKESVWTVPEEIADVVASLDWPSLEEEAAREKEITRLQKEMEREGLKRKAETPHDELTNASVPEDQPPRPKRRKAQPVDVGPVALTELAVEADDALAEEGDEQLDGDDGDDDNEGSEAAFSSASAEEAWQREMAEGMAKLAEEEAAAAAGEPQAPAPVEEDDVPEDDADAPDAKSFKVPNQVNLSNEEARALFRTLLDDKQPNALAPFSIIMPSLITDPRYVLLPSQSDRETVFNEWCRDAARKSRAGKPSAPSQGLSASSGTGDDDHQDPDAEKLDPKQAARSAYDALLKEDVTSTRTTWDEFRRKWKKDRRFFAFGKDEREREKVFKAWLKDLGERKRAKARKAELEFMELLKSNASSIPITPNSAWKDVKRPLVKDPRYDAVGSSSLREELFKTFLNALASGSLSSLSAKDEPSLAPKASAEASKEPTDRKARAEKALREREEQARLAKGKMENDIGRSKAALNSAEAETDLMSFYVDSVREPTANYHDLEPTFNEHPRFASSSLPPAQKRALFHRHLARLTEKFTTALHALFLSHSPLLSSKWSDLGEDELAALDASLPAQKLGLKSDGRGSSSMYTAWSTWMSARTATARADFQKLLEENSFIEFWGKVGKLDDGNEEDRKLVVPGEEDLDMTEMGGVGGVKADENEDGVGGADLKALARGIGEVEVERVLKNDQRYRAFDHMPKDRLQWVKDYLTSLSAPGRSVHVQPH